MRSKIKGIIFDLDDTLFDCTGQLTEPARHRAAQILSNAHPNLSVTEACQQQTLLSQTLSSADAIRILGSEYKIPSNVVEQALDAYNTSKVEAITPFPDVLCTLETLSQNGYLLTLVTSGHPDRQRNKVRLLNLESYFSKKNKTLFLHDDRKTKDKGPFLAQAAKSLALDHTQILAVGDKLTAEIAAAKRLNMTTVHMRHGRQKDRQPQTLQEQPDYKIDAISNLLSLLPSR